MDSMQFWSSSGPIIASTQNTMDIHVKGRQYTGLCWKLLVRTANSFSNIYTASSHSNDGSSYPKEKADTTRVETSC